MTNTNQIFSFKEEQFQDGIKNTVNARDLHKNLKINTKYADWVKKNLTDFVKDQDYVMVSEKKETMTKDGLTRGTIIKEYFLTIDTAKSIAMMQRNETGQKVRQYFIETEKAFVQQINNSLPESYEQALEKLLEQVKENKQLQIENFQSNKLIDECISLDNVKSLRDTATRLQLKPNKFNDFLRAEGLLRKKVADDEILPTSKAVSKGWLITKHIVVEVQNDKQQTKKKVQTMVTELGYNYFCKRKKKGDLDNIKNSK